ncbi:MAG: hypothetical protein LBU66_02040 [Treponema sp.]|jgi:hypothetical protein|nr:hypothetical protein [Treponema sp.]
MSGSSKNIVRNTSDIRPSNENPCVLDIDLGPSALQRCKFYHGVSRDKALTGGEVRYSNDRNINVEGFKPDGHNKNTSVCCGESAASHYGFRDGRIYGLNCVSIYVDIIRTNIPPSAIKRNEQRRIISAKYTGTITVKIILRYNEIFYPRRRDGVTEDQSKAIYLHELGHQLDTWAIVPKEGIIKVVPVEREFFGDNITSNAQSWLDRGRDLLHQKYSVEYKYKTDRTESEFHKKWGKDGNPWDGIILNELTHDELNEREEELTALQRMLSELETNWQNWKE